MAKAARRSLIALAGVVALLVAVAALLESHWAREWLENQVSQRLNGRDVEIGSLDIGWGWPLSARLENVHIANPAWAREEQMLDLAALEVAVDPGALLQGKVKRGRLHLERPEVHLARGEGGMTNWDGLTGGGGQSGGGSGFGISPDILSIDEGHLTYRDAGLETDLSASFATERKKDGDRLLNIEVQGTYQGMPLELHGRGGAPSTALAEQAPAYPVKLEGHVGQVEASFEGQVADIAQLDGLMGTLSVEAPADAKVAKLIGRPELELPAID
ncbi:MAG: AsmA family protein, partial [Halomonas sp.]|nr:AsmA family protein [Halomonas sp.]